MLVLGAFRSVFHSRLRPLRFISISSSAHSRLLSTSYNSLARPYRTRLWYRRDGTPRSKREGAIYVTLALLLWLPYNVAVDIYRECELMFYLIHVRRINSYCQFDFSQPSDMVDYIFKIGQISIGKKQGKDAKEVFLCILKASPETRTYIRNQLEELRNLAGSDDVNEDTLETARAAWEVLERIANVLVEKGDHILGIRHIKEERQKSDAKDLYQEVG